jgi:predicted  nucleic acid-binding Zn-ribbon protein
MTLEDRVAALTAELAQVNAETAKLRKTQSDTSEELSHIRATLANAEIGECQGVISCRTQSR